MEHFNWKRVAVLYDFSTDAALYVEVRIQQIDSMLPCVCSVIDHIWRQNVVRTKKWHMRRSFGLGKGDEKRMGTRFLAASSYNDSIVYYRRLYGSFYWTGTPDNVRYSLDSVLICSHIFFITVVDYDWRICAALLFPVQNAIISSLPEMFPFRSASLPKSCCVSWSWASGIPLPLCLLRLLSVRVVSGSSYLRFPSKFVNCQSFILL